MDSPTLTLAATNRLAHPPSAANRIWARLSLRAECLPPLSMSVSWSRSAWLNSTRYRYIHRRPPRSRARHMN